MTGKPPRPIVSTVLIVEDQGLVRSFLERWIEEQPGFALAGSTRSGEEALAMALEKEPDVAIVDFQLPGMDGLEFVRAARQVRPQMRALVVTSLLDALTLTRVRESGVEGFVEKDASPEILAEALEAVARGRQYFSRKYQEVLAREGANATAVGKILSRREQEVLTHVLARRTNREIAALLALSERTVEFHRANLMGKLGATNFAELQAKARQRGC